MKYIRQFINQAAYIAAKGSDNFFRPCVSLLKDSMEVKYDDILAKVGDYLFSDLTFGSEIGSKTPIAVCVAPASHFTNGKARWMSLVNMSATDPEHGTIATGSDSSTNDGAGFCWGYNSLDIPGLTDYTGVHGLLTDGEVTEANPLGLVAELTQDTKSICNIPTDYTDGNKKIYPFVENIYVDYYQSIPSSAQTISPYPFNQDGSKNELYGATGDLMSELDGAANTDVIIALSSKYATGTITRDDYSEGSYPAAVACHRFTAGVADLAGQWYLPAIGELGYVTASIALLNTKLAAAGNAAVGIGMFSDGTYPISTLGSALLSSSEYSDIRVWISSGRGMVSSASKLDTGGTRVRAFLAY